MMAAIMALIRSGSAANMNASSLAPLDNNFALILFARIIGENAKSKITARPRSLKPVDAFGSSVLYISPAKKIGNQTI